MEYYAPETLKEAEILKNKFKRSLYCAGGTIINWKGRPRAKVLIDLKKLDINRVKVKNDKIAIGAMVTIQELADNKDIPDSIRKSAGWFSSVNIRNMATVGGTVTGSFFISNLLPVFLAYNSKVEYYLNKKKHIINLNEWLKIRKGIVCSVVIENMNRKIKVKEEKISEIDFPLIVTSIGFSVYRGKIKDPVVAVSGVSSRIVTSESAVRYLKGMAIDELDFNRLNSVVQKDVSPVGNIKASVYVKRSFIESHLKMLIAEFKGDNK